MTKFTSRTTKVKRTEESRWKRATTIGIDLSDRISQCCGIDDRGEIILEFRVATDATAFEKAFKGIGAKTIAIETGTHSPWVSRLLESLGHEVIVANSRKLRFVYKNRRKDDRVDARSLARVARLDRKLLEEIRHRSQSAQVDLELLRARDVLVATRTRLVNHMRGVVKSLGKRLPGCGPAALPKKAAAAIPPALFPALTPLLEMIAALSEQIRQYDRAIDTLAQIHYPQTKALRQVSGVGALTGLAFVLTLDDPHRFRHSRSVGAWLGLVPAKDDSGESRPQRILRTSVQHPPPANTRRLKRQKKNEQRKEKHTNASLCDVDALSGRLRRAAWHATIDNDRRVDRRSDCSGRSGTDLSMHRADELTSSANGSLVTTYRELHQGMENEQQRSGRYRGLDS